MDVAGVISQHGQQCPCLLTTLSPLRVQLLLWACPQTGGCPGSDTSEAECLKPSDGLSMQCSASIALPAICTRCFSSVGEPLGWLLWQPLGAVSGVPRPVGWQALLGSGLLQVTAALVALPGLVLLAQCMARPCGLALWHAAVAATAPVFRRLASGMRKCQQLLLQQHCTVPICRSWLFDSPRTARGASSPEGQGALQGLGMLQGFAVIFALLGGLLLQMR